MLQESGVCLDNKYVEQKVLHLPPLLVGWLLKAHCLVYPIITRFVVLSVITFVGAVYRILTIFVPVFRWVGQILHSQVKVIFPCVLESSNCLCSIPIQNPEKILTTH